MELEESFSGGEKSLCSGSDQLLCAFKNVKEPSTGLAFRAIHADSRFSYRGTVKEELHRKLSSFSFPGLKSISLLCQMMAAGVILLLASCVFIHCWFSGSIAALC